MIDILVYLFENFADFSAQPQATALARKLNAVGFDERDISSALRWLAELQDAPRDSFHISPHSLRVYTRQEISKLGHDALSFMSFLETTGAIDPLLREIIVERAMHLPEDPLSLDSFKVVVLMVLWCRDQALEPLIVEELLSDEAPQYLH